MDMSDTPYEIDSDDVQAEEKQSPVLDKATEFVLERFSRAEDKKYADEERFLRAYKNFRGLYDEAGRFTDTEKSKIFVKVTKTKVLAAYGQITEVLFGGNRFPLSVEPSRLPEGVAESFHLNLDPKVNSSPEAQDVMKEELTLPVKGGDPLPPGTTLFDMERAGPYRKKFEALQEKLVEGPGKTPTSVTFFPALEAAKKMEKKIHDQLDESGANKHLRSTAFEMALFGTGVMKGPFAVDKEYPNWSEDGEYDPEINTVPVIEHVSVWNFYPDPDAQNMEEAEYVIQRHKMSKQQLKQLKSRPFFIDDNIDEVCADGPNYTRKYWELVMEDDSAHSNVERYEVLEFWGHVDTSIIKEFGVKLNSELSAMDSLNCNIWVTGGKVIRMVLNPFKPVRIPYYATPYEMNPYSFFGIGVAENMEDTQVLMNGFMRLAVDNAVLSSNIVFEVDEANLRPGQDLKVYPGKVFVRSSGAPGQAIFATKYPNVTNETLALFDKARILSDESTGFPSYAHGQTEIQGVGRTASGISMLMNAANGGIRSVVKNIDDYLLGPLGKAFFAFNMQFDFDPSIKGDLEVIARGTESLMANEVRSQRLMQFLGVVANPLLAPFAKMDVIVREIAKSLDLDPDKIVNNVGEAAVQAEVMKGMLGNQGAPPQPGSGIGSQPAPPAGAQASDPTGSGGGNIGTGMVPTPGEPGFSANTSGNQGVPQ
jgi:hypothetical protein